MSKQYFTDEFKIEAVKQITELGYSTSSEAFMLGDKSLNHQDSAAMSITRV